MLIPQSLLDQMTDRPVDEVTDIIMHHSAEDPKNIDISDLARAEQRAFGFLTIGYHFVIRGDGSIQVGRPITKLPAAALGRNMQSVDICIEGNYQPDDRNYVGDVPSAHTLHSAAVIINDWVKPKCKNLRFLIGHRDVARITGDSNDATACPGDLLYAKLHDLRIATKLQYH